MLRPRIIPCLLIHDNGLVKTKNFKNPSYIGDPINAVKIYNEKEVDELIVCDIDASVQNRPPNLKLIKNFAEEARMPLCYVGGVKTLNDVSSIIQLGIEKVGISSAAFSDLSFIKEAANLVGSQSIVVVLDIKKSLFGGYGIYINNGTKKINKTIQETIYELQNAGIGEIVINSVDRDGTKKGYDFELIEKIINDIKVPMTLVGGVGSFDDFKEAIERYGIIGISAGSLFVYQGRYDAVLINFLSNEEKNELSEITTKMYKSLNS